MDGISRRSVLQSVAGVAALPLDRLPAQEAARSALAPVGYSQVQLLDGPLKRQFDVNHQFFLRLDEDRMLKIYRQRAGLPAPGDDMGGWYDDFCPGASFGQYVSALARFAAVTGSEATRAKVSRLVHGCALTMDPSGKFFADLRYPAYTYDKLVCGLIDAHSFAGDPAALTALAVTTRAARPQMPDHALTPEERRQRPHKDDTYLSDESYTLAENLFLAYERSGDRQYFDMARRYLLDRTFFDPLAEGRDVLPGLHAYSHMNALSSGMQGYLKLGNPKYLRAVSNAAAWILTDQSYATGGWGPNEAFVNPGQGALGKSLESTHRSFETPCGGYAHFKVMRYLLAQTKDSRYGDSMERILYNALLGVKPILEDGSSFYYSDYHASASKTYTRVVLGATRAWDLDDKWPCCSGTLPQVVADYGISSYLRSANGVYVNLYVPSRLTWVQGSASCSITQETDYPAGDRIALSLAVSSPSEFAVHLRIPAWAGTNTGVSVNGHRLSAPIVQGKFLALQRTWKAGDKIELELHQPVRFEAVDRQTSDRVAMVRGAQVLFAIVNDRPSIALGITAPPLKPAGGDWLFQSGVTAIRLRPFASIGDETYQTYWAVTG